MSILEEWRNHKNRTAFRTGRQLKSFFKWTNAQSLSVIKLNGCLLLAKQNNNADAVFLRFSPCSNEKKRHDPFVVSFFFSWGLLLSSSNLFLHFELKIELAPPPLVKNNGRLIKRLAKSMPLIIFNSH